MPCELAAWEASAGVCQTPVDGVPHHCAGMRMRKRDVNGDGMSRYEGELSKVMSSNRTGTQRGGRGADGIK